MTLLKIKCIHAIAWITAQDEVCSWRHRVPTVNVRELTVKEMDLKGCNGDVWEDLMKLWTLSPSIMMSPLYQPQQKWPPPWSLHPWWWLAFPSHLRGWPCIFWGNLSGFPEAVAPQGKVDCPQDPLLSFASRPITRLKSPQAPKSEEQSVSQEEVGLQKKDLSVLIHTSRNPGSGVRMDPKGLRWWWKEDQIGSDQIYGSGSMRQRFCIECYSPRGEGELCVWLVGWNVDQKMVHCLQLRNAWVLLVSSRGNDSKASWDWNVIVDLPLRPTHSSWEGPKDSLSLLQ